MDEEKSWEPPWDCGEMNKKSVLPSPFKDKEPSINFQYVPIHGHPQFSNAKKHLSFDNDGSQDSVATSMDEITQSGKKKKKKSKKKRKEAGRAEDGRIDYHGSDDSTTASMNGATHSAKKKKSKKKRKEISRHGNGSVLDQESEDTTATSMDRMLKSDRKKAKKKRKEMNLHNNGDIDKQKLIDNLTQEFYGHGFYEIKSSKEVHVPSQDLFASDEETKQNITVGYNSSPKQKENGFQYRNIEEALER